MTSSCNRFGSTRPGRPVDGERIWGRSGALAPKTASAAFRAAKYEASRSTSGAPEALEPFSDGLPLAFSGSSIFHGFEVRDLGDRPLYAVMNGRVGWRTEAEDLSVGYMARKVARKTRLGTSVTEYLENAPA